jgi:hypothetical protein
MSFIGWMDKKQWHIHSTGYFWTIKGSEGAFHNTDQSQGKCTRLSERSYTLKATHFKISIKWHFDKGKIISTKSRWAFASDGKQGGTDCKG